MQPFIHEAGNQHAMKIAQKAQQLGISTRFNEDPQVSVDTFKLYEKYTFFHPDTDKNDANAFATLVRECIHFEIETIASMLTFGLDVQKVYPHIVISYIFRSCRGVLKDKYPQVDDKLAETFARDLVQSVYEFIQPKLELPVMNWQSASISEI